MKKTRKKGVKATQKTKTVKTTAKRKSKATKQVEADNLAKRLPKKAKTVTPKKRPAHKRKSYAEIGAEGEQQIYNWLVAIFGINNVFKNVYVMRKSGRLTEIDLLAIHSTGVFVVESKNYSGLVCGDGNDKEWVHIKSETYKRNFYSPVAQNAGHIDALREACQYHLGFIPPMLSLLVFPDHCEIQVTNLPQGLRCCRLSHLPTILGGVFQAVPSALSLQHLQALAPLFYQSQLSVLPSSVKEQHLKDVAMARKWANK